MLFKKTTVTLATISLLTIGCASKVSAPPAEESPAPAASTAPATETKEETKVKTPGPSNAFEKSPAAENVPTPATESMSVKLVPVGKIKPDKKHPIEVEEMVVKQPDHTVVAKEDGVDANVSLGWLKNGNTRFLKHWLRKDGQYQKDVIRVARGQHPHAIILSCADSRVPPEIVFDQRLGEVFVVRTAGETLDPSTVASIEYAVSHLGPHLLVVMGHTSCGAVKAAIDTLSGGDAGSPSLNHLVADIHPRIRSEVRGKPSPNIQVESWANARGVARDILERSQIVAESVRTGKLRIVSALYDLNSGKVDFE